MKPKMVDEITKEYVTSGLTSREKEVLKEVLSKLSKQSKSAFSVAEILKLLDIKLSTNELVNFLERFEFINAVNKKINKTTAKITYSINSDKEFINEILNLLQ